MSRRGDPAKGSPLKTHIEACATTPPGVPRFPFVRRVQERLAPAFKRGRVRAEPAKGSDGPLGPLEWQAEGASGLAC